MSNKSAKQPKQLKVPRDMKDINIEYQQTCAALGQAQYHANVKLEECKQLSERIKAINQEANARQTLDAQKAKDSFISDNTIAETKAVSEAQAEANK